MEIVASSPEIVVIAGHPVHTLSQLHIPNSTVVVGAPLLISAVDEIVKHINILSQIAAWRAAQSVGTVVVVIGGVRSDGYDRFQALYTGGCCRQGQCTVIRSPGHPDIPIRRSEEHSSALQ